MARNFVCLCNLVTEDEIIDIIKKGCLTVEEVQEHTAAGTSCGKCLPAIDYLVYQHGKGTGQGQIKIKF